MKKLGKLTLKELENGVAVIGNNDAKNILGGTSWETMEQMMEAHCWTGGYVDGVGYVSKPYSVSGSYYPTQPAMEYIGSKPVQGYWSTMGDVALGVGALAYGTLCAALAYVYKIPDEGSFAVSYTNFQDENPYFKEY